MLDRSNRTFICSVAFLDIAEYSKRPVAEQIQLKDRFNTVLQDALRDVPVNDRIILDTGDGAAISFLGDPEDALFLTVGIRDATAMPAAGAPALPIRLGINVGPVRLVKDVNGQPNIIGDGINVAQRVMGFAEPGQILVSRSYYEVVSRLSEDYAHLFRYEGSRTDKHVRAHDVYSVGHPASGLPKPRARARSAGESAAGPASGRPPLGRPWLLLWFSVAAILSVAVGIRILKQHWQEPSAQEAALAVPAPKAPAPRAPAAEPAAAAPAVESPAPAPATQRPRLLPLPRKQDAAQPPAAAAAPAQVLFAVLPWGEVYVDGKFQGVTPPLRLVEVPPGRHTIEVRNTTFPPHTEVIDLKAEDRVRIRHRFVQEEKR